MSIFQLWMAMFVVVGMTALLHSMFDKEATVAAAEEGNRTEGQKASVSANENRVHKDPLMQGRDSSVPFDPDEYEYARARVAVDACDRVSVVATTASFEPDDASFTHVSVDATTIGKQCARGLLSGYDQDISTGRNSKSPSPQQSGRYGLEDRPLRRAGSSPS